MAVAPALAARVSAAEFRGSLSWQWSWQWSRQWKWKK
jgi:hypothetical protein